MQIRVENLKKIYYKRHVVREISLEVNKGEIVGLLGPNGAGKTTTFYMVVGIIKPNGGKVFLGDRNITKVPMHIRARLGIGFLPQEASVFRKLTVKENILLVWQMRGLNKKQQQERLPLLLADFGLSSLKDQPAYTLSGGERRRVELARALANSPSFLLLDEPFTGIDPIAIDDIQKIITRLKEKGIGILITDHNVRETLKITDRAYIISEGRIIESGTAGEVARSPLAKKYYLGEGFRL